ncbi:MAG: CHAT domain-containing protein [Bacteroidota bacterium]
MLPEAYAYLARWKGLLLFAIRQQSLAMRPAEEERVYGDAVWQIEALREQLVAWQQRATTDDEAAWLAEQQALVARKNALERDLLRSMTLSAEADPLPHPDRLVEQLAPDEALLDVYRYYDYSDEREHYAALVVTGQEPPVLLHLGDAAALDRHLMTWRAEVLAQRDDADAWTTLTEALWGPAREALPTAVRKLWVSPDGALGRLPWSRFADDENREPLLIAQVDAPRELAGLLTQPPTSEIATGGSQDRVLLVGDVDFGEGTTPFAPLPGTAREVAALEALARREGVRPVVLVGDAPDKIALNDRLDAYPYVHLATHGSFWASAASLSESRAEARSGSLGGAAEAEAGALPDTATRLPLLESGLAVVNANAGANGLFTAEELIGLDLSEVEVMVLSACDTGRGAEVAGQGVLGLRAALATAGVRTLLLSLWPVPDASTALLMERFYEGLWSDGLAPAKALRQAQSSLRADPRYAAPVHWAAWVLAGEGW